MGHINRKAAMEALDRFCDSMNAKFKKQQEEKKAANTAKPEIELVDIYESPRKDANRERNGDGLEFCQCCAKKLGKTQYTFHASTSWLAIPVALSEEEVESHGIDSQGWFNVGASCAKKFPKGYIQKNQ